MSTNPTNLENLTMSQLVERMGSAKERPSERDRDDAAELADKVEGISLYVAERLGNYDDARILLDSAWTLREQAEQIENAVATVSRLLDEIRDLRDTVATYRVVETFPATRETPAEYGVRRRSDPDLDGE